MQSLAFGSAARAVRNAVSMYPSPIFCWSGESERRSPFSPNASLTTSHDETLPLKCVATLVTWFFIADSRAVPDRLLVQPGICECHTSVWP